MNQSAAGAAGAAGLGIIRGKKSRTMLNLHCNNNVKKKMKKKNAKKKKCEKKNTRKKCMRPLGREPTICRLIDNRANHYATESAASMEDY